MPEINSAQWQRFVTQMIQIGIVSYREQENLWNIAQRCAKTAGVPMAGAGALTGASMGAIPGAVVGALVGLATGTGSCVMLNAATRQRLRELARGS